MLGEVRPVPGRDPAGLNDGASSFAGPSQTGGEAAYYFATPYFREMIETLDLVAVVINKSGRLLYCNSVLLTLTGHGETEAIGADWFKTFLPADEQHEARERFERTVLGAPEPRMHKSHLVTSDGSTRFIAWTNTPLPGKSGEYAGIAGIGVDITDALQTQAALEESEARFRELTKAIDDVFWMAQWSSRKLLLVNPAFERVFGRPLHTLFENPLSWLEVVHPEDKARAEALFRTAIPPRNVDTVLRILLPSGEVRWIHHRAHAVESTESGPTVVVGIAQDITRQHEDEEKILRLNEELEHRVEARTRQLAEALSQLREREAAVLQESAINQGVARVASALISLDRPLPDIARIVLDEACRLAGCKTGFVAEFTPGASSCDVIALSPSSSDKLATSPADRQFLSSASALIDLSWAARNRGVGFVTNNPSHHPAFPEGLVPERLGISSFLSVPAVAGGEVLGQISLANKTDGFSERDLQVCERLADLFALSVAQLRHATELETTRDAAEAASHAKSEFLSTVSHELRSPLNVIIGLSDVLAGTKLADKQRYHLDTLRSAGDVLLRLVNEVLDLARIEAGRVETEHLLIDLVNLVDGIRGVFNTSASQKGLALSYNIDPGTPLLLCGDMNRLRQILVNLVGNAVKFTPKGHIELRVFASEARPEDRDRWDGEVALVHFCIRDTGIGIPKERLESIFEGFTQVDASIARQFGGSGLGLTIALQFAHLLGGSLSVTSELGQGSTFDLAIPLEIAAGPCQPFHNVVETRMEPNLEETTKPTLHSPVTDPKVLLVEDSLDNQAVIEAFLENTPIELSAVSNGFDAFKKFEANRFSLVLMDIQMPLLDGLATTRLFRQWELFSGRDRTPIVALSAHAITGAAEAAYNAGCDEYLTKPIRKDAFLAVIAGYLGRPVFHSMSAPIEPSRRPRSSAPTILAQVDPALLPHLGSFLASVERSIDEIKQHLTEGDLLRIADIAHRLKGDGGTYGLDRVSALGLELQNSAKGDDPASIARLLVELTECVGRVAQAYAEPAVSKDEA